MVRPTTAVRWAQCSVCHTVRKLRKDGKVPKHLNQYDDPMLVARGEAPSHCPGSGEPPKA
jgi:hypothetical protein